METAISYQFPVSQSFEIKEVLDLNFNILPHPEAWVDLNRLRKEDYLNDLYYHINYKQGRGPERIPQLFKKIIFTGHRGCGKTFELYRLVQELHQPRRFFCIYIDCETELPLGEFEWQDFFVLMVRKLAEKAAAYPSLAHAELQEIAKEWQVNTEIHETIGKTYHDVLTGDGHLFQEFQQDPARFKMAYSRNTETAAHIRRVVKSNPYALAKKMSAIIATLRQELRDREEYDDILFVFDGTEKVGFDKYRDLFIDNYAAVSAIDAHLISAIPIAPCYML